jgi:myo-inositol-1-phosphate synthase
MTQMKRGKEIPPASGKLGILLPGMGAVATTCIAGVELVRRGLEVPVGSLTQLGTIRVGKGAAQSDPKIRNFIPLAPLSDLVFGGWDPIPDDCYDATFKSGVLEEAHRDLVKDFLQKIRPMSAVFDPAYVPTLRGATKQQPLKPARHDLVRLYRSLDRKRGQGASRNQRIRDRTACK